MPNFKFDCGVTNAQVIDRLNEIEKLIYNPYFKVVMNDTFVYFVSQTKHKLAAIRGVTVLEPNGEEVETAVKIFSDKSVRINSNINLEDSTLIIY